MAKHPKLQAFYSSPKWVGFRRVLIMQRRKPDGSIVCEHCDKIIRIAKDIVGHHKTELTVDNVDDHSISLNPDNVELICFDCHNKEHKRFGYQEVAEKKVYLVYGAPLSGKSTLVRERAKLGDLIVDMDELYCAISGLERYNKPNNLLGNVLGVYNLLIDNIAVREGKWNNAWIIGGFADRYRRNSIAKRTGAELIFCDVSQEECLRRLSAYKERGEHEAEWRGYIAKWFESYTA